MAGLLGAIFANPIVPCRQHAPLTCIAKHDAAECYMRDHQPLRHKWFLGAGHEQRAHQAWVVAAALLGGAGCSTRSWCGQQGQPVGDFGTPGRCDRGLVPVGGALPWHLGALLQAQAPWLLVPLCATSMHMDVQHSGSVHDARQDEESAQLDSVLGRLRCNRLLRRRFQGFSGGLPTTSSSFTSCPPRCTAWLGHNKQPFLNCRR